MQGAFGKAVRERFTQQPIFGLADRPVPTSHPGSGMAVFALLSVDLNPSRGFRLAIDKLATSTRVRSNVVAMPMGLYDDERSIKVLEGVTIFLTGLY